MILIKKHVYRRANYVNWPVWVICMVWVCAGISATSLQAWRGWCQRRYKPCTSLYELYTSQNCCTISLSGFSRGVRGAGTCFMVKSVYSLTSSEKTFRLSGHASPSIYIPCNSLTRNSITVAVPSAPSPTHSPQTREGTTNVLRFERRRKNYTSSPEHTLLLPFHLEVLVHLVEENCVMKSFITSILCQV
jgi:hypothetical protein